ncbi:alkaline phosphatase D family protein [Parashewanella tropica]|uniref:alkaline phosphatase D family protein n=1 Tax=Parashewanella tropica TaxID=2547970 RepID=UPI00105A6B50|nr:alkaline phosphatase D family protein [Parashewanella tropica]
MQTRVSRRDFLAMSAKGVGAAVISYGLMGCSSDSDKYVKADFLHGIASGDPTHESVILWTRVTPEKQGEAKVSWQVATDSNFDNIVTDGEMITTAERDYTVKVDAIGLRSGQGYYYRFRTNKKYSVVGHTKTLPQGEVAKVKLAVMSCSNYPAGYFNVYEMASKMADLDAVVHLGDYIYEYDAKGYGSERAEELGRVSEPKHEILSLTDYRLRYAQYRTDLSLQNIHKTTPFIAVWDDHEVSNDTYKDGAENHDEKTEGSFEARKEAALQAYFEWLPIRPWREGNHEQIYRSFQFGDLVDLYMLDTRIIGRDKQLDIKRYISSSGFEADRFRADVTNTDRTMLGQEQLTWLQGQLLQSTAKWQVLGQQVLMGRMLLPAAIATRRLSVEQYATLGALAKLAARAKANDPTLTPEELQKLAANQHLLTPEVLAALKLPNIPYNLDAWDGYAYEREVILTTAKSKNHNLVVLAGDTHNAWANELKNTKGEAIGVEFATASVTSPGLERYLNIAPEKARATEAGIVQLVEDLKYMNSRDRGFMTVEFTHQKVSTEWHFVDTITSKSFKALEERYTKASTKAGEMKVMMG